MNDSTIIALGGMGAMIALIIVSSIYPQNGTLATTAAGLIGTIVGYSYNSSKGKEAA